MADKVAWAEFRKLHIGVSRELKSMAWNAYKTDKMAEYLRICEEAGFESPLDVEVKEVVNDEPAEPEVSVFEEYAKLSRRLGRFAVSMTAEEIRTIEARLAEIARDTAPDNYKCTPTDGWQIWFGPTQHCLLINTTRQLAFTCSRSWWRMRYLNAMYVQRELVNDAKQIVRMRSSYEMRKKLVKRAPLPGVEIMLPTTASEYQMRS
jgi:hypothetical protein